MRLVGGTSKVPPRSGKSVPTVLWMGCPGLVPGLLTLVSTGSPVAFVRPLFEKACDTAAPARYSAETSFFTRPFAEGPAVLATDYDPADLHFAYCSHAYLRFSTRARRPCNP